MPSQYRELTPKNIIIDVLRIVGSPALSNKALLEIGALFGYKQNAMRVATTRLVSAATIEKLQRSDSDNKPTSHYRLSPDSDPLSLFIEEWRLGEDRLKAWQGNHWLLCHLPTNPNRSQRTQSLRALTLLGFRQGPDKLWMRPDNLAKPFEQLEAQLRQFGLEPTALLIATSKLQKGVCEQWQVQWANQQSRLNYQQHFTEITAELNNSQARLTSMPAKEAMTESFRLGGNAINLLVKDPLLPTQIENPKARETLCRVMRAYDATARTIWQQKIDAIVRST